MRLFFGEPRLVLMGVDLAVLGEERALRIEGIVGVAVRLELELGVELECALAGDRNREGLAGLMNPA